MNFRKSTLIVSLASAFALSACYVKVNRDGTEDEDMSHPRPRPTVGHGDINITVPALPARASQCDKSEAERHFEFDNSQAAGCYSDKNDDYKWRVSCQQASCQGVPVFVYYMLTEDLGSDNVVYIEAFDNAYFMGTPKSVVRMGSFQATKPGQHQRADLYLAPGEYFVRAYISNEEQKIVPYPYQNMQMVSNKPTGVYGAVSGVKSLQVKPRSLERHPEPLHVYLDQLFKKQQGETPTNANLRVKLSVGADTVVEDGRKIIIEILKDEDLQKTPVKQFEMASESLLVEGRKGKAEFVASNLPTGEFFVFAFLDSNSNGYFDAGELSKLHAANGTASKVKIISDRTEAIELTLTNSQAE